MRELGISYGRSCHAKIWANDTISFNALIDRLRDPVRTPETVEEYRKLKGDAKQKAKDKGGFVGGILKDGKRNGANVLSRSMLVLDADRAQIRFLITSGHPSPTQPFSTRRPAIPKKVRGCVLSCLFQWM